MRGNRKNEPAARSTFTVSAKLVSGIDFINRVPSPVCTQQRSPFRHTNLALCQDLFDNVASSLRGDTYVVESGGTEARRYNVSKQILQCSSNTTYGAAETFY